VARVFLDHVLHPVRFDRGVVAHALRLYAASNGADASAAVGPEAAQTPLRRRALAAVGSGGGGGLRGVFTEWMRVATLCAQLQRACLQPAALALCASTRMVCVVARNALQPLQAAAEPECLHALAVREPAAAVLLSAPAAALGAFPALARTRGEAAHVLAAAMFLAAALPGAAAARLGDALARDACGETLVAHEARAVELFAAHCGSLGARHIRHAARLLRRCDDPAAAVRGVLQALAASPAAEADEADDGDAFCASATMVGLCVAAFAGAAAARIEVARAVAVLLVAAAARPAEMPLADVPGALAAGVRVLGLCAVPHWVAAQPC
ncbi:hypothetical protein LPJ66_012326, partial [Kickxella alabastrina]